MNGDMKLTGFITSAETCLAMRFMNISLNATQSRLLDVLIPSFVLS